MEVWLKWMLNGKPKFLTKTRMPFIADIGQSFIVERCSVIRITVDSFSAIVRTCCQNQLLWKDRMHSMNYPAIIGVKVIFFLDGINDRRRK